MQLVLASSSRYRRALLGRLGIPFSVADPDVAEETRPGEGPEGMARRLAEAKSLEIDTARCLSGALIIRRQHPVCSHGSGFASCRVPMGYRKSGGGALRLCAG